MEELTEETLLALVAQALEVWDPILFKRKDDSMGAAFIAIDTFKRVMGAQ